MIRLCTIGLSAALAAWALADLGAAPAPAAPAPLPGDVAAEVGSGPVYGVIEISFVGPTLRPIDVPAREIDFSAVLRHESGRLSYRVHGYWDGDGKGGAEGNVFKLRFCPTLPGRWTLAEVASNVPALKGQMQGQYVSAIVSSHKGFWLVDPESPGRRWYRRSDGSHPYIFGNTHYSFVSGLTAEGRFQSSPAADVAAQAAYFNKLRFGIHGDRYGHPTDKPFLDSAGEPTDDGDYSCRPNPGWFLRRVDPAVQAAWRHDVIADIILCGPDTPQSRSILRSAHGGDDGAALLKYVAARYGSFPNVWFCLANEWDIKSPSYTAAEIRRAGAVLRSFLPYPTPVSVHGNAGDWKPALNSDPSWNDHVIIQRKLKHLAEAADAIARSHALAGGAMPVINDELAYEGSGDGFSRDDVLESHLGAFLGGGYATTGFKPANKKGQYFWGRFSPTEHTAAEHLAWMRKKIDSGITFWKMRPVMPAESIFVGARPSARALEWPDHEYALGTREAQESIVAKLPAGVWKVRRYDVVAMEEVDLGAEAVGTVSFDAPASRAVLFHFKKVVAQP